MELTLLYTVMNISTLQKIQTKQE